MKNNQSNSQIDWDIPSIFDIIDRMEFKWLVGSSKKKQEESKKKRKYTKRSNKKL